MGQSRFEADSGSVVNLSPGIGGDNMHDQVVALFFMALVMAPCFLALETR